MTQGQDGLRKGQEVSVVRKSHERIDQGFYISPDRCFGDSAFDDSFWCCVTSNDPDSDDPDIEKPILQVRVSWPGASPKDVEQEIVFVLSGN